jgi:hypothetical protein
MSQSLAPNVLTYLCAAALAKGVAVKVGADDKHVVVATAATDKVLGITQNATTVAEQSVEVAIPGGGGKALLGVGGAIPGDLLVSNGTGGLIASTTPGDRWIAMAIETGLVGDIVGVDVCVGLI